MTGKKKAILVLANHDREGVAPALKLICQKFTDLAEVISVDVSRQTLDEATKLPGEIVVVLGGDGTLLGVARAFGDNQRPLLGINLGKLGYLAEFSPKDTDQIIALIKSDRMVVSERLMLEAEMDEQGNKFHTLAVNDVVLQAGQPFRMIEIAISIDGEELTSVRGDGVIIATPTGSTGHNISAGGPVVDPLLSAIVFSPISAHSLTHRPVVLSGDAKIEVTPRKINPGSALIVDGQITRSVVPGVPVRISRAKPKFLLVHNRKHSRWHTLQTKLNWGVGPNYKI